MSVSLYKLAIVPLLLQGLFQPSQFALGQSLPGGSDLRNSQDVTGLMDGWKRDDSGGVSYVLRMEPQLFKDMGINGTDLVVAIPEYLRGVADSVTLRVGSSDVERAVPVDQLLEIQRQRLQRDARAAGISNVGGYDAARRERVIPIDPVRTSPALRNTAAAPFQSSSENGTSFGIPPATGLSGPAGSQETMPPSLPTQPSVGLGTSAVAPNNPSTSYLSNPPLSNPPSLNNGLNSGINSGLNNGLNSGLNSGPNNGTGLMNQSTSNNDYLSNQNSSRLNPNRLGQDSNNSLNRGPNFNGASNGNVTVTGVPANERYSYNQSNLNGYNQSQNNWPTNPNGGMNSLNGSSYGSGNYNPPPYNNAGSQNQNSQFANNQYGTGFSQGLAPVAQYLPNQSPGPWINSFAQQQTPSINNSAYPGGMLTSAPTGYQPPLLAQAGNVAGQNMNQVQSNRSVTGNPNLPNLSNNPLDPYPPIDPRTGKFRSDREQSAQLLFLISLAINICLVIKLGSLFNRYRNLQLAHRGQLAT